MSRSIPTMPDPAAVARVEQALAALAWAPVAVSPGHWRAEQETAEGPAVIELVIKGPWLVAGVTPFLDVGGDHSFELSRWLLRQNWDMHQAKFAYGSLGEVLLLVELPTEHVDVVEIETALRTLVLETTRHRRTLREALESSERAEPGAAG